MKLLKPKASKKSLEKLLAYLGKTENYSKYYKGNRAEDFNKCFDIESPWCCMYADLVLRGLKKRKLGYSEGHHAVPRAFYGVKRNCLRIDAGNLFTLSYAEHVWAHYCLVWCAIGKMHVKMVRAFLTMYRKGICNKHALMPSETELLDAIPEIELRRIQAMEPQWAKVEAEGRTHKSEDLKQFRKDYYEANKEKLAEKNKAYYEANKEKLAEKNKAYRESNREKELERTKAWRDVNKEKLPEYWKAYREANKEKLAEKNKAYREANKEKILEKEKAYREANKEKILERAKAYREANKEKILERAKARYEANREKILERKKARYEASREKILERDKVYREANKKKIAEKNKAYRESNREKILERKKAYYEANKEKIAEKNKAYSEAKKAAGYRFRRDPAKNGKRGWVFVGLPETPKSSTDAA